MKTLRILILVISIPLLVSAMLSDAVDQGGFITRTLQISSTTDDLDLLCDKLKHAGTVSNPPRPVGPFLVNQRAAIHESAFKANTRILLPFFLRAPPLA
jgi:hypothetical protein